MQGRLVPSEDGRIQCFPSRRWRDEFPRAVTLGFDAIEWIYESHGGEANPIVSAEGVAEILDLSARWGVVVGSLCADILMDEPVFRVPRSAAARAAARVPWLLERCRAAGLERLVLPFVGQNEIRSAEELEQAAELLGGWADEARRRSVELHLETALDAKRFVWLLDRLGDDTVKVTYDIGNSLQFGFDAREELAAYGHRVGSVHVKDSKRGGTTVPLGEGDADFGFCFRALAGAGYRGPIILQAARVPGEDEMITLRRYLVFVRQELAVAAPTEAHGSRARR
jgi:hexulose-6-phosphate isomerase